MSDPWLEGPLTSAAYGWRLERPDGVTLGFTSHDQDIEVDGLLHRASPGMAPSSITETLGIDVDGLDVRGAMTANAIRDDDLRAGRWDGARLSIFLFDWSNPSSGKRVLANGSLGAIAYSGNSFEAEFKGPAAKLDQPVAPFTSPGCRARFCDAACGLSAARFTHDAVVASSSGSTVIFTENLPVLANAYQFGALRWMEGPNCGLTAEILVSGSDHVQLVSAPSFPVAANSRVEIAEGCDKTMAMCSGRFGNAVNFRGEPYLPGNDLLTRYPGAS